MKSFKIFLGVISLIFFLYLFVYLKYSNSSFILVYHRISEYKGGLRSLYVRPKIFKLQMNYLYLRGYKTVSLKELAEMVKNKKLAKKVFCITFDDGYKDLLSAYNILKKYNFKATVYLHVEAVRNGFYSYPNLPNAEMISIEEINKTKDVFCFGSHTLSHPDMSTLSLENIIYEIKQSKELLEKLLNSKIEHFCYPFGKIFKDCEILLKDNGYQTAVTLENKLIDENSKVYLLPRIEWKDINSMSLKNFFKNIDFYLKIFFGV